MEDTLNDQHPNAKYWTEKKLLGKIREFEKKYGIDTKMFLKRFNEHNYQNFEGKREERFWYYYTKVLVERNKEKKIKNE